MLLVCEFLAIKLDRGVKWLLFINLYDGFWFRVVFGLGDDFWLGACGLKAGCRVL